MADKIDMKPALNLAFMGDAVYEIMVREYLLAEEARPVAQIAKKAQKMVNAKYQSLCYHHLKKIVDENELMVMKRGRNATSHSKAKSASILEYRNATGVEALFGYLYLKNEHNRLKEIFKICMEEVNNEKTI